MLRELMVLILSRSWSSRSGLGKPSKLVADDDVVDENTKFGAATATKNTQRRRFSKKSRNTRSLAPVLRSTCTNSLAT